MIIWLIHLSLVIALGITGAYCVSRLRSKGKHEVVEIAYGLITMGALAAGFIHEENELANATFLGLGVCMITLFVTGHVIAKRSRSKITQAKKDSDGK